MNFGTTKYEHSVLRKYFLKTAVYDRGSISLVFWCPYFDSRFPTVAFQIFEMPIELFGVGTDPLPGRFQLPTPNNSIGPSEVARDCFKAGCFRLPLVGGRFQKYIYVCSSYRTLVGRTLTPDIDADSLPADSGHVFRLGRRT